MPSHLPVMLNSKSRKPVIFPPGRARPVTKPAPDRIGHACEHDRDHRCISRCNAAVAGDALLRSRPVAVRPVPSRTLRRERPQAQSDSRCGRCGPPPIRAFQDPAGARKTSSLCVRIILRRPHQNADVSRSLGNLRACRHWPRNVSCPRTAEQRDELAALHSITSSASCCNASVGSGRATARSSS